MKPEEEIALSIALSLGPDPHPKQMIEGAHALQQRIVDEIDAHKQTRAELARVRAAVQLSEKECEIVRNWRTSFRAPQLISIIDRLLTAAQEGGSDT